MRVLITGSTGFLGKNVLKYFASNPSLDFVPCNLRNTQELNNGRTGVDVYLHLAGKAHDLRNTSSHIEYFEINTIKTQEIFQSFLDSSARVFIFVSSVKAISDVVYGEQLLESDSPNPITSYGQSKLAAENSLSSQILPGCRELYILRPCMIHGPNNKGNLNLLYNLVKKGIPWPLGAFENKRSFLSVENFCFVLEEILSGNLPPGTYNLADSEPLSTNEVIQIMSTAMGKRAAIWRIPKILISHIAKMGDVFHLPLNTERLQKLTENYVVSNQKLLKALGKPLPVEARLGMMKTIKFFEKS
jgi:nucleoside-diphosphate-sugar epimerase